MAKIDASGLAGGLIAAATLDALVKKGLFTVDEAREVLDTALRAIGPDMHTDQGAAAAQAIASSLGGKYSKHVPSE